MPPLHVKIDKRFFATATTILFSSALVGISCGIFSALLLYALNYVTNVREMYPWLLFGLPAVGILIVWVYAQAGKPVEAGNALLLEAIHDPKRSVPFRMLPLIFLGTVATHLCGGSAGREGTAVQMGGALANGVHKISLFRSLNRRVLLMSGISGGFASVFGTPIAGAVFGFEILGFGKTSIEALIPCFVASFVGDVVCRALGITHVRYALGIVSPEVSTRNVLCVVGAGLAFGIASQLFVASVHRLQRFFKLCSDRFWLRPLLGGIAVIALTGAIHDRSYLGLSIPLIQRSFSSEGVPTFAFLLKIIFTALTISSGFKGGEVTPLMCIGATLGATIAKFAGLSAPLFAALGFVSVFGAAANAPLACAFMGMEIFGFNLCIPFVLCSTVSFLSSGEHGIYLHRSHGKLIHLFSARTRKK